jgi:4-amino-4-deoxy-L-arabinose transferase-like glycosyltransferase
MSQKRTNATRRDRTHSGRPHPDSDTLPSRDVVIVLAITASAVLLRLLFLWTWSDTPFSTRHFSDSKIYIGLAERLLSGEGLARAWFMSPMYPWLLSLIMRVTEDYAFWLRFLQLVLGCVNVYIVWRMGRMLFGPGAAVIAAILTAASVQLIFYESMLLPDALLTVLTTGSLYFLLLAVRNDGSREWLLSGMFFGLAVVSRASVVLFLPLFVIAWMFLEKKGERHFRGVSLWAVMSVLMLLPSAIHNYTSEGVIVPVTSSFGYNLFAGNNAEATGLYHMPEPVDLYSDPNGHYFVEGRTGREMNSSEVSSWWRDGAVRWIVDNPADFLTLLGKKLLLMLHPGDIDQVGMSMAFVQAEYGTVIGIPLQVFPVILLLALIGVFSSFRTVKTDWPLRLFFFTYLLSTALFFVSGRLRLPLLPLLHLYAGYAAVQLWLVFRTKSFWKQGLLTNFGVALGVIVLLFQPHIDQRFEQEYLKLGQVAFDEGRYQEAAALFRRSVDERPTIDGYVNHGNALAAQGQFDQASVQYHQALGMDSTSVLAWFNFGNMWMQRGDAARAHTCWLRSVQANARFAPARRNLGLLLFQAGRLKEAEEQLAMYVTLETDAQMRATVQCDLDNLRSMLSTGTAAASP